MKIIDLHTHTVYSDGTYSPRELIEYASKKGLSALAVTDHDTVSSLHEAKYWADQFNIEFVPGVEIAAIYDNIEIHILGLFIDYTNKTLNASLDSMKAIREKRNREMVKLLNNAGIDMTYDELALSAQGNVITRAHFAKLLVKKGYIDTINDGFKTYLKPGTPTYISRQLLSPESAIASIHDAAGLAILAHPKHYGLHYGQIDELVANLKRSGLDGIEAIYTTNTKEDKGYFKHLAKKHTLKISGGSDFHGANKPKIDLGCGFGDMHIGYEVLEKLKQ